MAKRKAARTSNRTRGARGPNRRARSSSKSTPRKKTAGKAARKPARRAKAQKAPPPKRSARTSTPARRTVKPAAQAAKRAAPAVKRTAPAARRTAPAAKRRAPATNPTANRPAVAAKGTPLVAAPRSARAVVPVVAPPRTQPAAPKKSRPTARPAPGLNRTRRTLTPEDLLPSPPSSLDLDRSASSVRSGRRELLEKYRDHTETGPVITGGDVDADWESAYSVGDEAPGGDNPTPDQDIVDEIGRAVGLEYQDNEELKGEKKIIERDRHRWELDPASADDWEDR